MGQMVGQESLVTARIGPVPPLLHRGLVRAAVAAGFTIVPAGAAAVVTLRVFEAGRRVDPVGPDSAVDIAVRPDAVVLTVHQTLDVRTILVLQGLLTELLDTRPVRPG